jgi:hypothetical protein
VGTRRQALHPVSGPSWAKLLTASRPWYQCTSGGIDQVTSSLSRATSASASPFPNAAENPATICRRHPVLLAEGRHLNRTTYYTNLRKFLVKIEAEVPSAGRWSVRPADMGSLS